MRRIKDRKELAELFAEKKFNLGVEVGVLGAGYSQVLWNANPALKLFGVDSYPRAQWRRHKDRAVKVYAENNGQLIEKPSLEAVNDFEDSSLDFVYIDGNHDFDNVMRDIIVWTSKVKTGGIVSGHDYVPGNYLIDYFGVREATLAYTKCHGLDLNLTADGFNEDISWWFYKI